MTDHTMEEKRNHAVLVGLHASSLSQEENASDATLEELEALLETAGGVCVGSVLQNRETPEARTFIGEGKVAEVAALVQAHAQHRVPVLAQGLVHGEVGLGAGVGLHIGIIGAEELLGPLNGDVLHHVHALTAAVVALAGIALGVLVRQVAAHGRHDRGGDEVLRGDQLDVVALAAQFQFHRRRDLGIGRRNQFQIQHIHILPISFAQCHAFLHYRGKSGESARPEPIFLTERPPGGILTGKSARRSRRRGKGDA